MKASIGPTHSPINLVEKQVPRPKVSGKKITPELILKTKNFQTYNNKYGERSRKKAFKLFPWKLK